jgi:ABC-2 type transport system permease protein
MRVTTRALLVGWRAEISAAAEYRADLVVGTAVSTVWLGLAVIPALIVFDHIDVASGWTLERLLLVQAIWYLMDGVLWIVVQPNLWQLSEQVRSGDLDFYLLQPGSALARMSLTRMNPADLPKIALAAILGAVAIVRGIDVTPAAAAFGVVGVTTAIVLMWAISVLTHVKTITAVQFDAGFALHSAHNLARIPVSFYGRAISVILTFVVPIAFLSTIPAEIVFGASGWVETVASVGVATAAVLVTWLAWRRQIREYTGATA